MCSGDCTSRSSPNRIVLAAGSLSSLTSVLTLSLGFARDLFLSPRVRSEATFIDYAGTVNELPTALSA